MTTPTAPDVDHVLDDLRRAIDAVQSKPSLDVDSARLVPAIQSGVGLAQDAVMDRILGTETEAITLYRRLLTVAALAIHAAHQDIRAAFAAGAEA